MKGIDFMKRTVLGIFALCFVTVAAISIFQLSLIASTYGKGAQAYDNLTQFVTDAPKQSSTPNLTKQSSAGTDLQEQINTLADSYESPKSKLTIPFPTVDFDGLGAINSDVAAWLILEGSQINYPVVHAADNVFYLNHTFDGTANGVGTLFIDSNNASGFADQNTIIYGHHMKDGSMFADLLSYQSQAYFEKNPQMLLLTPEGNYLLELFAAYTADVTANSWKRTFDDEASFSAWIAEAKELSDFISDVDVLPTDRVVTLSTCSYSFENARYVVVGRLVRVS